MRCEILLASLLTPLVFSREISSRSSATPAAGRSSKRGLVYVPSEKYVSDDEIWIRSGSDLTWYYNYGDTPSSVYTSDSSFEFVPMLFSAPTDPKSTDITFLTSIASQLKKGANISHVLAFNEPDGATSTGGSNLTADTAASAWMRNIAPLRSNYSVKVGLPAVTGSPNGFKWLANFNQSCESLNAAGCEADFIPIHWYGDFAGFASHIGQVRATYPTLPIWVTEYNLPNASLTDTESFSNTSAAYLDSLSYMQRYSQFASFRSDVSNIGPNAAFLTQDGKLTDIGSWYLGGGATGNKPKGAAPGRLTASMSLICVCGFVASLGWAFVGVGMAV